MSQSEKNTEIASGYSPPSSNQDAARVLPSGRQVVVRATPREEAIEVRSANGEMEIRIVLSDTGPVLQLRGARLEIDSTDTVAVNCRQLELNSTEGMVLQTGKNFALKSQGELHMKSMGETFIDGDMVNINCQDRTGYHDDPARLALPPQAPAREESRDARLDPSLRTDDTLQSDAP